MTTASILILSDSGEIPGAGFICACDREAAAGELKSGRRRAICLDRNDPGQALSDARWLRRRRNRLPVVALVAPGEVARATELLAVGVDEIVVRGVDVGASILARLAAIERRRARPRATSPPGDIAAHSPAMRACLERVEQACHSDAGVLLQGETGSGKEVIARAIHAGSRRARGPFVAINCAAFPETLLESELFGYERGAFTGAERAKRGHFETAAGGTLFLDEIGETGASFQVKLLRVLQERVVRPLGALRETPIDLRIIAATNRDLLQLVESGRFRRDLYYRLHVLPIALPPLRARGEDVLPLAEQFLERARGEGPEGANVPHRIGADAARLLETYSWHGNVRELENEIARAIAASDGEDEITARMLSPEVRGARSAFSPDAGAERLRETMDRFESWVLRRALERHGGRRIVTARSLGITRECLYK